MNEECFAPREEFRQVLDAIVQAPSDFVLYCKHCEWHGELNAAHAHSTTCPRCGNHGIRIWRGC